MSSISSAQEPKSKSISICIAGHMEVKPRHTLILQEGPNGHLLAFLFFWRCTKASVKFLVESAALDKRTLASTTAMRVVQRTHDCDLSLMSALREPAPAHLSLVRND